MWAGLGGEGHCVPEERSQTLSVHEGKHTTSEWPWGVVSQLGWLGFSRDLVLVHGIYLNRLMEQFVLTQVGGAVSSRYPCMMAPQLGVSLSLRCGDSMEPGKLKLQTPTWGSSVRDVSQYQMPTHGDPQTWERLPAPNICTTITRLMALLHFHISSPEPGVFLSPRQPKSRAGMVIPESGCASVRLWKASGAIWVLAALGLATPGRHLVSPASSPGSGCSLCWLMLGDAFFGGSQLFTRKNTFVSSFPL